jgi:predicted TIM-barrel fold metal-dependent hydrolase
VAGIDLTGVPVVDAHTHPYRLDDLLERDPDGFDTRMMFLGESFASSSQMDDELWPFVHALTGSTVFAIALHRWLAEHLGCEPNRQALVQARTEALHADPVGYTKGLLDAAGVVAILSDEGYPQPPITAPEFEAAIGVKVHRVARLEPWILTHREGAFDDLVAAVHEEATQAMADPNCVAFKSIVAYRTGLDVGDPSEADAREAFAGWRADEWRETREHAKPVRDLLIRRTLEVAKEHGRAFHFHCGGGDPDIDLVHAKPQFLFPLLIDVQDQPVVLVHSGYPWVREAAYIASVLPNVYLELSELIPWGFGQVEWALEMLVGTVPAAKLLYGSDEGAEAFWISALPARRARSVSDVSERDYVTAARRAHPREVLGWGCRALMARPFGRDRGRCRACPPSRRTARLRDGRPDPARPPAMTRVGLCAASSATRRDHDAGDDGHGGEPDHPGVPLESVGSPDRVPGADEDEQHRQDVDDEPTTPHRYSQPTAPLALEPPSAALLAKKMSRNSSAVEMHQTIVTPAYDVEVLYRPPCPRKTKSTTAGSSRHRLSVIAFAGTLFC